MSTDPDITITNDFVADHAPLFRSLVDGIEWDDCMRARKTASFGVPYNYSQMSYAPAGFPDLVRGVAERVANHVGWTPNSCLLNYYPQRRSSMGMHADNIDRLHPDSGIAIVSLGAPRVMVFERDDGSNVCGRELRPGSLMVMGLVSQRGWRHGVPARPGVGPRISMTFRHVMPVEQASPLHARAG
ncbi:MAG: alpha-ketoglutarate-dependent dioxygenase AlkB [Myxococcota bacterium]